MLKIADLTTTLPNLELLKTVDAAGAFASTAAATFETDDVVIVAVVVVAVVEGVAAVTGGVGVGGASSEDSLRVRL